MTITPKWHRLARNLYRQGTKQDDIAAECRVTRQDVTRALRIVRIAEPRPSLRGARSLGFIGDDDTKDVVQHLRDRGSW